MRNMCNDFNILLTCQKAIGMASGRTTKVDVGGRGRVNVACTSAIVSTSVQLYLVSSGCLSQCTGASVTLN